MKVLLSSLLLVFFQSGEPTQPPAPLQEFVRDAVSEQLSDIALADKYFCTAVLHRTDKYGEKARKELEWALTTQRAFLREQQVKAADITIVPFDELSANELPPKPFHILGETTHVYVARYHGKILSYFLLQDNKIASTLLIDQGGERYFLDFCQ